MRRAVYSTLGEPESVVLVDAPETPPRAGEILIDVEIAAVAFIDVLKLAGAYQYATPLPFTPGNEITGVVRALGAGVSGFEVGQPVLARALNDACREQVSVPAAAVWRLPPGVDQATVTGFSAPYSTAAYALQERAALRPGETLLVLGAAGALGLAAVDLGRMMGAKVIACASTPEKLAACRAQGADALIDYEQTDLRAVVKQLTGGVGVDVIFDPVGGNHAEAAVRSMAWKGRYLVVGFAGGEVPRIPLNLLLLKGCSLVGVFAGEEYRRHPDGDHARIADLLDMVSRGELRPYGGSSFSLDDTGAALRLLRDRRAIGPVTIRMRD